MLVLLMVRLAIVGVVGGMVEVIGALVGGGSTLGTGGGGVSGIGSNEPGVVGMVIGVDEAVGVGVSAAWARAMPDTSSANKDTGLSQENIGISQENTGQDGLASAAAEVAGNKTKRINHHDSRSRRVAASWP
jgi:hypothetical protein